MKITLMYAFIRSELPHDGPVADLVWSDPTNDSLKSDFSLSPRGAGYLFSAPATRKFLHMNGLDSIVRAHQLCQEGYQIHHDDLLVTVWSAPNYVYRCGNDAAILELSESLTRHFNIFGPAPIDSRGDPEFLLTPARRARLASLGSERPSYIPSDPRIAAIWHAMDDAEYFGMPVDDEWEASPLEDEADVGPGDHGVHGKGAVEAYFL